MGPGAGRTVIRSVPAAPMGEDGGMDVTGYHHVALTVSDLDRSEAWYAALVDLEVVLDEPGELRRARVYRLAGTHELLGLVQHAANDGAPFSPTTTGLDHVAFSVATREALDDWVTRLDELGIEHSGVIEIPMGAILNLHDPDGIAVSVFWDRHPS